MRTFPILLAIAAGLAAADTPNRYVCYRAAGRIEMDGKLEDSAWKNAPWTDLFVDIEGDAKPRPRFRTRVKMLWDDQYFYIAADLEEPHVWGALTKHDSVIFHDNDFEVFLDPNGDRLEYYELEINALNTTWDLFLPRPYKDGGKAQNSWEIAGLRSAVHIDGTLNDPGDTDRGWSVELGLPWKALAAYAHRPAPPRDGDEWRINFSRVERQHQISGGKYRKVPGKPEDNWVWSPQGVINMHVPEMWGYVRFSIASGPLAHYRDRIDGIDVQILALLNERARVVQEIGRVKRELQMPVQDRGREEEIFRRVSEQNQGPLPPDAVRRLFERIIEEMRRLEQ